MKSRKITYEAGGVVWRAAPRGREVLLILRPKYRDWTLPKGHIEEGESWDVAVQREVKEETGYDTVITGFAGFTSYNAKRESKVVLYWRMEPASESEFKLNHEVSHYEWFSPLDAIDSLTYENDKDLLRRFVASETAS